MRPFVRFLLYSVNFLASCIICWILFEKGWWFDGIIIFTVYGILNLICAIVLFVRHANFPEGGRCDTINNV